MKFKLMLFVLGVSFISFMGCKKHEGRPVTIQATNLEVSTPGTLTGTFTASGAFNSSGTHVMVVVPVGTDSIHCTTTFTAPEGTFLMLMKCEAPPMMSGAWKIVSGTGAYAALRGSGPLTMRFPPDPSVPAGALGVETMTGEAHLHP